MARRTAPVDRFMANPRGFEAALLLAEHNVNLHSDGTGDEWLDGDANPVTGLRIVDEADVFGGLDEPTAEEVILQWWQSHGLVQ